MQLTRRDFGLALGGALSGTFLTRASAASTALPLSISDLVAQSDRIVLGRAVQQETEWAVIGGARRIVTRSRLIQEADFLRDEDEEDELSVLTLGGRIGDLGQKVAGEADLLIDQRAVVFVGAENGLSRRVIGMAQGYYPLQRRDQEDVLLRSPELPHLMGARRGDKGAPPQKRAVDALHLLPLKQARALVRGSR